MSVRVLGLEIGICLWQDWGCGREAEGGDDDDHRTDSAEAENGNARHFERKTSREELHECMSKITHRHG